MKRVLVVVAHPDDEVLGCGGLISKYHRLDTQFRVIFLAEGTTCRFKKEEINSEKAKNETSIRTDSAKRALGVLEINDYHFYDFPCGRLDCSPIIDIGKIIEEEIKAFKPDSLFTHSDSDVNNDHRIVFQAVLQATRPVRNIVKKFYSMEILSSSEWRFMNNFNPNFFVALQESDIEQKIKSLIEYSTEVNDFPFPRSPKGVRTLANLRGMQVGTEYAEAFKLIREISI